MLKRALLVLTSHDRLGSSGKRTGFWLSEVTHFQCVLGDAGFDCDFTSPKGGRAPLDEKSLDLRDAMNRGFMEDPDLANRIATTLLPRTLKAEDYDLVYFAGGHGAMWDLADDPTLKDIARVVYERGGIVAAVCHGVAGLLNVTLSDGELLVKGRNVTSFTNAEETLSLARDHVPYSLEDELKTRGAAYRNGPPFQTHVEVCGRLVTGQNPQSAVDVADAVVDLVEHEMRRS